MSTVTSRSDALEPVAIEEVSNPKCLPMNDFVPFPYAAQRTIEMIRAPNS